jgi:hypothetical protein
MCLRMMVWSLMPLILASVLAWAMSAVLALSIVINGQMVVLDLPFDLAMIGAIASLGLLAVQSFRLWRWKQGKGMECFVCECLLGREREGRWGLYRTCLGCGKNHSMQSRFG